METYQEIVPCTNETLFGEINLAMPVQEKLQELGFKNPTEIQRNAIPILLEKKNTNFHGQAQTGTGKTLAFGLPLIHRIDQENKTTQGLIIAPTRELALQIFESIIPFAKSLDIKIVSVYGGVSIEEQIRKLNHGAHIVIGTPGRIMDHIQRRTMDLSRLKTLVLDEADIMLDMGFREDIESIMTSTPKDREIWLFSATVKSGIRDIINQYMPDVQSICSNKTQVGAATTKQYFCVVPMHSRLDALCRFIECAPDFYGFIFCQTKMLTSEIADQLARRGLIVGSLHGDLSQSQRNNVVKKFKNREYAIVVATDVAGRGIDIQDLTHVINYSLPEDFESYIHRTGRTGRAGKEGIAITFINRSQARDITTLERKFKITINPLEVPSRDQIIAQRVTQVTTYVNEIIGEQSEDKNTIPAQAIRALNDALQDITLEQWKTIAQNLLYTKHLKSIFEAKKEYTANASSSSKEYAKQDAEAIGEEIMFHVGLEDNISENDIRNVLKEKAKLDEKHIIKVRVIQRRTFVRVLPEHTESVINALIDESINGRRLKGVVYRDDRNKSPRNNKRFGNERTSYRRENSSESRFRPSRSFSDDEGSSQNRRFSGPRRNTTSSSSRFGSDSSERKSSSGRKESFTSDRPRRFSGERNYSEERSTFSSRRTSRTKE